MILIDNMDMPTSCEKCKIWSLCWAEDPHWWKREEDCPLHEVEVNEDVISRQAVLDAVDTITKWSLLDRNGCHVGVGMKYRDVKETVKSLPPSPSRPQEHEKSCDGCEWEDAEGEGCTNCARFYVDFYQNKRNEGTS